MRLKFFSSTKCRLYKMLLTWSAPDGNVSSKWTLVAADVKLWQNFVPCLEVTSVVSYQVVDFVEEFACVSKRLVVHFVAERISYFCLARNSIRPLGSTHNFTQSGWLILFFPNHLSGQHKLGKPPNTFFLRNSSFRTDVLLSALQ